MIANHMARITGDFKTLLLLIEEKWLFFAVYLIIFIIIIWVFVFLLRGSDCFDYIKRT